MKQRHRQQVGPYKINYPFAAGSYGKVYHATLDGKSYAIKQIAQPVKSSSKIRMDNEIKALSEINHINIVRLYEVLKKNGYVYMVMECCQCDLREMMEKQNFSEEEAINILTQIVRGFKQLLKLHIVHRDVKPANILFQNGVFKIADFGLVKYIQEEQQLLKTKVGTPYYMCPQILKNQKYTSKCDIWSLGIIFYQLVFGCLPWYAPNQQTLLKTVLQKNYKIHKQISPKTQKLLDGMLQIQQNNRMSWNQLFAILQLSKEQSSQQGKIGEQKIVFTEQLLSKLLRMEIQRISQASFFEKFENLRVEDKKSVVNLVIRLFKGEYQDMCLAAIKL